MKTNTLQLNASVAKSLFLGRIVEQNLFPFPRVEDKEVETLRMVLDSVDKFMANYEAQYREFDRVGAHPSEYIDALKELGLFGLIIPEEFGGLGLSNSSYSRVLQQSTRLDSSTTLTIGAHSSIGLKGVLLYGTPDQKTRYLPRLASGEMIASFCLTEPGAGSDAASIKTSATKNSDDSWSLNGEKIWITNGAFADFFTVFARTEGQAGKITAFLVERSFAGVSNGPKEDKMGIRASATTTVVFQNVRVPAENVLGEVGKGFKVAMGILNSGRTGLGGGCVGAMKQVIQLSSRQSSERKQFGKSISEFPLVKEKIAQMTVNCFAAESAVQMLAHYIDSGVEDYSVEAAMSKIFASEALWQVAYEGLQIAGGNGFMRDFQYERITRDARIMTIFEGTNEILRLYVGLCGFKEAGDYLKGVKAGVGRFFEDPIKGFGVLSQYAGKKVSQLTPFGREKITMLHPALQEDGLAYERYTKQLARATESLLQKHGKDIVGQQYPTKRVTDVAIDLFVGLCVLSRVSTMLKAPGATVDGLRDELSIARIFTRQAKRRINANLRRIERNEDQLVSELADSIVQGGQYRWDIF